jgi:hypothetical protein
MEGASGLKYDEAEAIELAIMIVKCDGGLNIMGSDENIKSFLDLVVMLKHRLVENQS